MNALFVYGTLRHGAAATHYTKGFKLCDYGRFPYVIRDDEGSKHLVLGNVEEVDKEKLAYYDYVEGTASGFYDRTVVTVYNLDTQKAEGETYIYIAGPNLLSTVDEHKYVPKGDWVEYPKSQPSFVPARY